MITPPDTAYSVEPTLPQTVSGTGPTLSPGRLIATPDNPPWGIPSAVITWVTSIAFLALVPNLGVLPYVAYHYRGLPAPTEQGLLADKTFVFLFVLGWVPAHLLTLALIWAVATRLRKYSLREVFGLSSSSDFGIAKSAALAITLFIVSMLLVALFGGQQTDLDRILQSSRATALTLAIIAVATAPLVEEMIYRGLLYSAFQRVIGKWFAVVVVASMFAGLHVVQYWPNVGAISSITLLSVVLTVVRARTGRLLPCFMIHLVFNGVQSLIIVFEPYIRALMEHWRPQAPPVPGLVTCILRFLC